LGSTYSVSGPAIFKFEKGYVVPSLQLWLRMSKDMGIDTRTAVLMHIQEKLPQEYRPHLGFESLLAEAGPGMSEYEDFTKYRTVTALRKAVVDNLWLPSGLVEFARSEELWGLYKPTGKEVNALRDAFSPLGEGVARGFCDALRLFREFCGAK
jgi:hypothetical protein